MEVHFMKVSTLLISLLLVPVFCLPALATLDADSVLIIPRTGTAPAIDGVFDTNIYHNATLGYIKVVDVSEGTAPDDWFDNFGIFHSVWHDNFLYLYIQVYDDIIDNNTASGAHENDGLEIYFDGDNSKGDTYDGTDDSQIRFNFDETLGEWDYDTETVDFTANEIAENKDLIGFTFVETDMGYDLEVAFPIAEFNMIVDSDFGFDIQMNENDTGGRDGMLRWWGNNNQSWQNASVFGTARLDNRLISDVLDVNEIAAAPTIDGEIDAAWWNLPVFGQGTYVTQEAGSPLDPPFSLPDDWTDLLMQYRVAYDADAMYLLVEVTDDVPGELGGEEYQRDGIEVYVDANHSQGGAAGSDENYQWRWIYGSATGGLANSEAAWYDTDLGYNIEIKMPWADMPISPDQGSQFGWDLQINDNDGDADTPREHMVRWWSNDNNEWQDFSLCGTAQIGILDDIKPIATGGIVTKFELAQNYPNPFNPTTTIAYSVTMNDHVTLDVFNVVGEKVATLVNETQNAGTYSVTFDGSNLSSGIYLYRIENGGAVITKKMMLVK
jgi:hypothetical protein